MNSNLQMQTTSIIMILRIMAVMIWIQAIRDRALIVQQKSSLNLDKPGKRQRKMYSF